MTLEKYFKLVDASLCLSLEKMGEKNTLRDACEYALLNGGKRLRPIIVLMVAEALQKDFDVMAAALSVEFFHTASLIADDLPCMDNDDFRRGKPSLHKAFPENIAILASYTLIAAGYRGIYQNSESLQKKGLSREMSERVSVLCLDAATKCAGIHGATHGQFLDLYPETANLENFEKIVKMKTSSLFEIAFIFGWLFGGGSEKEIENLKKCAHHLGMAFQIGDDLDDDLQDGSHPEGSNLVHLYGREEAIRIFESEIASFRKALESLGLWTSSFQELFRSLDSGCRLPSLFWTASI